MARQNSQLLITAKDETESAFASVRANALSMQKSFSELQTVVRGFLGATVVTQAQAFGKALIDARIEADKLKSSFTQAVGSQGAAAELRFVRQEAERLGTPLLQSAESYARLAAAARGTNMEGAATREVFKSISEAASVFHLSASETAGALTAVQQMMSKGKVQAEELRGQLGERLPGAFQIAARAMGVTTAELDKMLVAGQVMADDFLPKFADQLRRELAGAVGDATRSAQADINRLANAWQNFRMQSSDGLLTEAALGAVRKLTDLINEQTKQVELNKQTQLTWLDRLATAPEWPEIFSKLNVFAMLWNRTIGTAKDVSAQDIANRLGATRASPEERAALERGANAFPGRDQAFRTATDAAAKWDDLAKKFRTAEQKAADVRKEITETGTAAGKSATEIEKLIAAATEKKGSKSDVEKAFDAFITRLKSEAQTAAKAMEDLQAEVDSFGLGDIGKQEAILDRLRGQMEGLQAVASGDKDAGRATAALAERIAYEERRLDLMRQQAEQERQLAQFREDAAARQKILDDAQASADKVRAELDGLRAENETRGMLKSAVEALTIARMEERLEMIRAGGGSQEYADKLQQEIEIRRQLKDQLRIKELADDASSLNAALKDTKSISEQLGLTFTSAAEQAIVSWRGFGNFIQALNQDILRIIVRRNLTEPLINSSGSWLATAGAYVSAWLNSDSSGLGSGFGGVGSGAAPYAEGGRPTPNQLALVGEKGPELWVPDQAGTVMPTDWLMRELSRGSRAAPAQSVFAPNITINVDSRSDRADVMRIARQGVQDALAQYTDARQRGEIPA